MTGVAGTDGGAGGPGARDVAAAGVALSRRTRWASWLLLGALSAAMAETLAGSTPLVLILPWAIALTVPVYLLHTLVLGSLVVRRGRRVSFGALYAAGLIFGLYEAYITKVLWNPPWDPHAFRVGGVAIATLLVVDLFWHPLISFTAPLAVGERLLGGGSAVQSALPRVVRERLARPRWVAGALLVAGAVHGGMVHSPLVAAASIASTLAVLWLLLRLWRGRPAGGALLADLLPRGREWLVLLALLLLDYLLLGVVLRRDALPPLRGQVGVWVLYAAFGALWWRVARRAPSVSRRAVAAPPPPLALPPVRRAIALFAVPSLAMATLAMLVGAPFVVVPLWGLAIAVGAVAFITTLREALGRQPR